LARFSTFLLLHLIFGYTLWFFGWVFFATWSAWICCFLEQLGSHSTWLLYYVPPRIKPNLFPLSFVNWVTSFLCCSPLSHWSLPIYFNAFFFRRSSFCIYHTNRVSSTIFSYCFRLLTLSHNGSLCELRMRFSFSTLASLQAASHSYDTNYSSLRFRNHLFFQDVSFWFPLLESLFGTGIACIYVMNLVIYPTYCYLVPDHVQRGRWLSVPCNVLSLFRN